MQFSNEPMTAHQALEELHELLRTCCQDECPPRQLAIRYQICRTAIIAGELGAQLPGFLRQCPSSMKFREFVHLYDRDPRRRMEFVGRSLEACWSQLKQRPAHEGVLQSGDRVIAGLPRGQSSNGVHTTTQIGASSSVGDFMAEPTPDEESSFWAEPRQRGSRS